MITVAVATVGVVGRQDVGALLEQDLAEGPGCVVDGDTHEAPPTGRVRPDLRAAAAVGVPELDGAGNAQRACARGQFAAAGGGEAPAPGPVGGLVGQAQRTVGGDHEDDAVPVGGGARHGPRREQSLVVGVGVEDHKGSAG